jgi:hypothetical protein
MKKEDVDKMTLQQAMDYSINKLVEQGVQCMDYGGCYYGDDEGRHCAVGWLLDEDNEELMDSFGTLDETIKNHPESIPSLLDKHSEAFETLQELHDSDRTADRKIILKDMTEKYGIDIETNPNWNKWVLLGAPGESEYFRC